MAKTGRPTKKTEERVDAICRALEEGHSIKTACALNDVHFSQYYRWMDDDPAFRERTLCARETGKAHITAKMLERYNTDDPKVYSAGARAAATVLKIQYPDDFQDNVRLSGDRNNPVQTETSTRRDYSKLTDEELEQLEALHAKAERE